MQLRAVGPLGEGQVRVTIVAGDESLAVKHIDVTGPTGQMVDVPPP